MSIQDYLTIMSKNQNDLSTKYCPKPLVNIGIQPFPYKKIIVLADGSGSTVFETSYDSDGFATRNGNSPMQSVNVSQSNKPKTKGCILAIVESIAEILRLLIQRFNLKGVTVIFYMFSNITHECKRVVVTDSEAFYNFIVTQLPTYLIYDKHSTNLTDAIKDSLFKELDGETLFILGTDGQANDGNSARLALEKCYQKREFDSFICGAGSVGKGITKSFSCSRDGGIREQEIELSEQARSDQQSYGIADSNCDMEYLQSLMKIAKYSNYFGAYGNYSHFLQIINDFFENVKQQNTNQYSNNQSPVRYQQFSQSPTRRQKWFVDTRPVDQFYNPIGNETWTEYSQQVSDILSRGKGVFFYLKIGNSDFNMVVIPYHTTNSGFKIGGYQIRCGKCHTNKIGLIGPSEPIEFDFLSYGDVFNNDYKYQFETMHPEQEFYLNIGEWNVDLRSERRVVRSIKKE